MLVFKALFLFRFSLRCTSWATYTSAGNGNPIAYLFLASIILDRPLGKRCAIAITQAPPRLLPCSFLVLSSGATCFGKITAGGRRVCISCFRQAPCGTPKMLSGVCVSFERIFLASPADIRLFERLLPTFCVSKPLHTYRFYSRLKTFLFLPYSAGLPGRRIRSSLCSRSAAKVYSWQWCFPTRAATGPMLIGLRWDTIYSRLDDLLLMVLLFGFNIAVGTPCLRNLSDWYIWMNQQR